MTSSPVPEVRKAIAPLWTSAAAGRCWTSSGVAVPSIMSLKFLRSCSRFAFGPEVTLEAASPIAPPGVSQ